METLPEETLQLIIEKLNKMDRTMLYFTAKPFRPFVKPLRRETFLVYTVAINCLRLLKWGKENGCLLTEKIMDRACRRSRLRIIKWLIENDCPYTHAICIAATKKNNMMFLKWCYEKCGSLPPITIQFAIKNQNLEMIKWLRKNGCEYGKSSLYQAVATI